MFEQLKFGSTITPEDIAGISFALMVAALQPRPYLRLASGSRDAQMNPRQKKP